MFGDGGEFEYAECSSCGCLQIIEIPVNLSEYYREDYYSFDKFPQENRVKQFFIHKRSQSLAGRRSLIGTLYGRCFPAPPVPDWLADARVAYEDKILDVGCGSGGQLVQLSYSVFPI